MAQLTIRDVQKAIRTFKKNGIPKKKLYYKTMLQDGTEKSGPIDELLDEKFMKELMEERGNEEDKTGTDRL